MNKIGFGRNEVENSVGQEYGFGLDEEIVQEEVVIICGGFCWLVAVALGSQRQWLFELGVMTTSQRSCETICVTGWRAGNDILYLSMYIYCQRRSATEEITVGHVIGSLPCARSLSCERERKLRRLAETPGLGQAQNAHVWLWQRSPFKSWHHELAS